MTKQVEKKSYIELAIDGAYGEHGPVLLIYANAAWIDDFLAQFRKGIFKIEGKCDKPANFYYCFVDSNETDIVMTEQKLSVHISKDSIDGLVDKLSPLAKEPHRFEYFDIDNKSDIEIVLRNAPK